MDFPNGVMVTVVAAPAAEDKYGDVADSTPAESDWGPVAIAPRTSTEREDSRTPAVVTGLTVYGPTEGAPGSQGRVEIASGTYAGTWDVEGIPGDWRSPFSGWAPGVEVALSRASAS